MGENQCQLNFAAGVTGRIRELFGRDIGGAQLAAAAGALDGAQVEFKLKRSDELLAIIKHPYIISQVRSFRRDKAGNLCVFNEEFTKHPLAPPNLGALALWRQVQAARELGLAYIETYAAGDPRSASRYGYYVWAVYGFNGPLYVGERRIMPPELRVARDLNQLIELGGDWWWRRNGGERKMIFDLAEESASTRILQNYLKRKGLL